MFHGTLDTFAKLKMLYIRLLNKYQNRSFFFILLKTMTDCG
jgi:hypothetical protein